MGRPRGCPPGDLEFLLERALLAHHDEARLGAAPLDDAAQEELGRPHVILLGEQELRDLEELLVEVHPTCLQSVTPASEIRRILTELHAKVLSVGKLSLRGVEPGRKG